VKFLLFLLTALGFSAALSSYYLYLPDFLRHNRYLSSRNLPYSHTQKKTTHTHTHTHTHTLYKFADKNCISVPYKLQYLLKSVATKDFAGKNCISASYNNHYCTI
jgi:hypothetical protein